MRNCFLFSVLLFFLLPVAKGQLLINPAVTGQQLAQALVGSGVQISNVVLTGSNGSYGKFSRNGTVLALDSGIVLTSGETKTNLANFVTGLDSQASDEANNQNSTAGDTDLGKLINDTTFDACVLEFDFVPIGDTIRFRYIFSSEEYPEYNCSAFNDAFAFFISGPGIIGKKNLALIPGTTIPVAINSVNNGIAGSIGGEIDTCTAMGPGSPFVTLYTDNTTSKTFSHDGMTVLLSAQSAVQACQTYHLKLVIADVADELLDSGVFLEAGSLSSATAALVPQFPADAFGNYYIAEGCNSGLFKVKLPSVRTLASSFTLQYTGTAAYGSDYNSAALSVTIPAGQSEATVNMAPLIDNLPEGAESLKIYLYPNCSNTAFPIDSLLLEVRDYDTLRITPRTASICKGGSVQLTAAGNYTSYSWTPAATLSNAAIFNPTASPTVNTTYIATAILGTCTAVDSARVRIKRIDPVNIKDIFCKNAADGFIRLRGNSDLLYPLLFSINGGAFVPDSNFNNLPVGMYTVRLRDAANCTMDSAITLIQAYPDLTANFTTTRANCNGLNGSVMVAASGGRSPYRYSLDGITFQSGPVLTAAKGNYTLFVRDTNNCLLTMPVVVDGDPLINISAVTVPASCSGQPDGQVTVTANGGTGILEYALNNGVFQPSNVLASLSGPQTVRVKDNNNCIASLAVIVPLNNTATVQTIPASAICAGKSILLTTTSNGTSFAWTPAATLTNSGALSPAAKPSVTTKYIVTATLGICTRQDSVIVTVLPAPLPNAGPDTTICFGTNAFLSAGGGIRYQWMPPVFLSSNISPNPVANPDTSRWYRLYVTADANGCNSLVADSVFITVLPRVLATVSNDTTAAVNEPIQLKAGGSQFFLWSPQTGLNNPMIANPVAILQNDITYTVTVSNATGCKDTAKVNIKVYKGPEIYVPNAFTPNGDGRNDLLRPIVIGFKSFEYFAVYNRWGQLMYRTADYRRGWDGTFKGRAQVADAYVWMARGITYKGQVIERKGSAVLIR